ncbi:MAG TPA: hypothetical protein VK753_13395 [Xanthomonadaceae bacterium]|jgi:hypothetical protein|nr:hypothetical protein [Xanthomonadaceae bacterium]
MTPRLFRSSAFLATLAVLAFAQPSLAEPSGHRMTRVGAGSGTPLTNLPDPRMSLHNQTTPPADIYGLQASFTQVNPTEGPNADGTDLWPCFGYGTKGTNPDCPTIGNPAIPFRIGGIVAGNPQYVWMLANNTGYGYHNDFGNGNGCDAYVNGTTGPSGAAYKPCGQIATWYEDNTNDSTDDLLQRIVVRQGDRVIYDSGMVDYGPAGPSVNYPVDVILNTDANFGYWPGSTLGPNNGNCSANLGYPLSAPANPGAVYVVAADRTCARPATGKATVTTSTILATPYYHKATGGACSGGASTCYTVDWKRNYEIHQDFDLFLE